MKKVSQMLIDISKGYIDEGISSEAKENLMRSVCTAWNIACFDPPERFDQLHQYMQQYKMMNNSTLENYKNMEENLLTLIQQKDLLYPKEKINILDVKVTKQNGQDNVSVSSTPF
jgi:hypothetical protein